MELNVKKIVLLSLVSFFMLMITVTYASNVLAWSNGGYSDNPSIPDYGTHDWIAEHALDWLPENEKVYLEDNLAAYLYGTELPDNGMAFDGIGDTANHHIYYWSNGSLQDDVSAVRAEEEYSSTVHLLESGDLANASKAAGIMSHYIVDVAVFGHVMGAATDWGAEVHHSDYETYVNQRRARIGIPSPELPPPMDGIFAHFSNGKTSNNIIEHNGDEITLVFSANNTITGNRVSENEYGIRLDDSNNNTIASNDVSSNKKHGIYLWWDSNNNTLTDNKVSENEYGIYFDHSSNNALTDNEVSNNDYGIHLHHYPENVLIGNEVLNNEWGIYLNSSRINSIHHNNFFNNTFQAYAFDSYNSWDDGYPSGGNYWSDYEERYPNATEIDGSGIWDTPYVIDENNQDNHPIVPEFTTWTPMLLVLIVTTVAVFIHKQRLLKTPKH